MRWSVVVFAFFVSSCVATNEDMSEGYRTEDHSEANEDGFYEQYIEEDTNNVIRSADRVIERLTFDFYAHYVLQRVQCPGEASSKEKLECWESVQPNIEQARIDYGAHGAVAHTRLLEPFRTILLEKMNDAGVIKIFNTWKDKCAALTGREISEQKKSEECARYGSHYYTSNGTYGHRIRFQIVDPIVNKYILKKYGRISLTIPQLRFVDYEYDRNSYQDWFDVLPFCRGQGSLRLLLAIEIISPKFADFFVAENSKLTPVYLCVGPGIMENNLGTVNGRRPMYGLGRWVGPFVFGELPFY